MKKGKKVDRGASVKAAKAFMKEFNIKEGDIPEEKLIKKLEENNNDIYQTFSSIFS